MRLLTLLVINLWFVLVVNSQDTCSDLAFYSQAEIDAFPINFPDCKTIEGSLFIIGEDIVSLEPLSQLEHVELEIFVESTRIINLTGLDSIKSVGFGVFIIQNPDMESIDALNGLEFLNGFINIGFNEKLKTISGFSSLNIVTGDLFFENLPALDTISGFNNLVGLQGNLVINSSGTRSLSVTGFDNFNIFSGGIFEIANNSMEEFTGFNNLTKIVGDFSLHDNNSLSKFDAFQELEFCDQISISNNVVLKQIEGFTNLREVGTFSVGFNYSLERIFDYNPDFLVGEALNIAGNFNLTSLQSLSNLDIENISSLFILGNQELSHCSTDNICRLLEDSRRVRTSIDANDVNCLSRQEIVDDCSFTTTSQVNSFSNYVYPNPTSGVLKLEDSNSTHLTIYDIYGKKLLSEDVVGESVDITTYNSGIYFLTLEREGEIYTQKIIKN